MTKYDHVWKSSSAVFDTLVEVPWVNPLNPDLKMHILLSVLHTFLMELVRRII